MAVSRSEPARFGSEPFRAAEKRRPAWVMTAPDHVPEAAAGRIEASAALVETSATRTKASATRSKPSATRTKPSVTRERLGGVCGRQLPRPGCAGGCCGLPGLAPGQDSELGAQGRRATGGGDRCRKQRGSRRTFQCYCQTDDRADDREVGRVVEGESLELQEGLSGEIRARHAWPEAA